MSYFRHLAADEGAKILELWEEGYSMAVIAQRLDRSPSTIKRHLDRSDVERRPRLGPPRRQPRHREEAARIRHEGTRELWTMGAPAKLIAEALGFPDHRSVIAQRHRLNLPGRGHGGHQPQVTPEIRAALKKWTAAWNARPRPAPSSPEVETAMRRIEAAEPGIRPQALRDRLILALWDRAIPSKEIAKALGVTLTTIYWRARVLGLAQPRSQGKRDTRRDAAIRELWMLGVPAAEIAAALDCNRRDVFAARKALDLPTRRRFGNAEKKRPGAWKALDRWREEWTRIAKEPGYVRVQRPDPVSPGGSPPETGDGRPPPRREIQAMIADADGSRSRAEEIYGELARICAANDMARYRREQNRQKIGGQE